MVATTRSSSLNEIQAIGAAGQVVQSMAGGSMEGGFESWRSAPTERALWGWGRAGRSGNLEADEHLDQALESNPAAAEGSNASFHVWRKIIR